MVVYIKSQQDKHKELEKKQKRNLRKMFLDFINPYIYFFLVTIVGVVAMIVLIFGFNYYFIAVLFAIAFGSSLACWGLLIFGHSWSFRLKTYRIKKQQQIEYIEFCKAVENRTVKSFDIITSGYEIISNVQDSSDTPKRLHLPIYEIEKIVDEKYKSKIEFAEYDYVTHKLAYYFGGDELPSKLRLNCEITEY